MKRPAASGARCEEILYGKNSRYNGKPQATAFRSDTHLHAVAFGLPLNKRLGTAENTSQRRPAGHAQGGSTAIKPLE
jgi:hypothetical protein